MNYKEIRNDYLSTLEYENTKHSVQLLFTKFDYDNLQIEELKTHEEQLKILQVLSSKNLYSLRTKISYLRRYFEYLNIEWLITNDDIINNFECNKNPIYITSDELVYKLNKLKNASDKLIPCLIYFMGIRGHQYIELRELKISDIDLINRIITLPNRTVEINNDYVLYLINETIKETWLLGEEKDTPLEENSPYLFKGRRSKNNPNVHPLKKDAFVQRIHRISSKIEINMQTLYQSYIVNLILDSKRKFYSVREVKEYLLKYNISCQTDIIMTIIKEIND